MYWPTGSRLGVGTTLTATATNTPATTPPPTTATTLINSATMRRDWPPAVEYRWRAAWCLPAQAALQRAVRRSHEPGERTVHNGQQSHTRSGGAAAGGRPAASGEAAAADVRQAHLAGGVRGRPAGHRRPPRRRAGRHRRAGRGHRYPRRGVVAGTARGDHVRTTGTGSGRHLRAHPAQRPAAQRHPGQRAGPRAAQRGRDPVEAVRGDPAHGADRRAGLREVFGEEFFTYLKSHPEEEALFGRAMVAMSRVAARSLAATVNAGR